MNRISLAFIALFLFASSVLVPARPASAGPVIDVLVDGRELPRRLLHGRTTMDLPAGRSAVLYVKWVPGIHAPRGPVENLAGFEVRDAAGETVPWERDWSDPFRFFIDAPEAGRYTIALTYITNQPSTNSRSIDSFGYPNQGVINTNTVAVYPEGPAVQEIEVRPRFLLPPGWKHGSALKEVRQGDRASRGDTLVFETVTFEDYVDKPLIAGRWLKTIELANTKNAHWYLHVSADEAESIPDDNDSLIAPIRKLCLESEALFGRTHFADYHFLLSLSDHHRLGIEHRNSSLNSDKPDTFLDKEWIDTGIETLLPHEVIHAWCGKYRRPAGMIAPDYQKPKETGGLWVYEGLDEYLEKLLAARAGFRDEEVTRSALAYGSAAMIHQKGRAWRPLYDTASSAGILRGGSTYWTWLRRGQDYYNEGVFIWLEIDARLREMTGGRKTLDDFCARFFSNGDPGAHTVGFERAEIVGILNDLAPYDWAALIAERVDVAPGDKLPEGVERAGWKLGWSEARTPSIKEIETIYKYDRLYDSVGFAVENDGKIGSIVPGSAAERAGLLKDMEIVGVDGRRYTSDRLIDAIKSTPETGRFELLVDEAERLRTIAVEYDGGLRYYTLERDESKTDWLSEILKPRTK
ncbi:MAG: hypothetical protein HKN20_11710 [Gemmatimonadetes bacterium]|nr:hypothetical protein [Gemmatimonadota bacterium]